METRITLTDLSEGTSATIQAFSSSSPSLTRLRELGLLPGTKITLVRRAPLGDPIEIRVRGSLLSLRVSEASLIEIVLDSK